MMIRRAELEGIRRGDITLAFRRWLRPRVLRGTRLRTALGVVEITDVRPVRLEDVDEADAAAAGQPSREVLVGFLERTDAGEVYRVKLRYAGPDPRVELRSRDRLTADEIASLRARLERLDRGTEGPGWPRTYLELIGASPSVRASVLAEGLGLETQAFKRRVRQLKELGLTESLRPGYRLSPRGRAVLAALAR